MLNINPEARPTALQVLKDDFFASNHQSIYRLADTAIFDVVSIPFAQLKMGNSLASQTVIHRNVEVGIYHFYFGFLCIGSIYNYTTIYRKKMSCSSYVQKIN
jgi:hypothetical protein